MERLERARAVALAEVGSVLTDDTPAALAWQAAAGPPAWSAGHYRLWRLAPAAGEARLLHAEAPGSPGHTLEERGGRPFVRVGVAPTALYVYAARAGRLRLRGDFAAGRLELRGPLGGRQELTVAGEATLEVAVPAGVSRLFARALAPPGLGATVLTVGLAPEEGRPY